MLIAQSSGVNVGALSERLRRRMLRFRIGLRRIRNILLPGDR